MEKTYTVFDFCPILSYACNKIILNNNLPKDSGKQKPKKNLMMAVLDLTNANTSHLKDMVAVLHKLIKQRNSKSNAQLQRYIPQQTSFYITRVNRFTMYSHNASVAKIHTEEQ